MSENKTAVAQKVDLPTNIKIMYYMFYGLNSLSTVMSLQYLTFFVTEWTGVSATLMASVYTFARFLDLGIQVFAGNVMQRVKRFRPFLIAVPLISQFGNFISFLNPDIPTGVKLIVLIAGYCMIHFPMNFWTIALNTLIMRVAGPNPENRMFITASNTRAASAMRIIQPQITMPLILWFIAQGRPGYLYVMLIYGVITCFACFSLYAALKPFETDEIVAQYMAASSNTTAKGPSFAQMYKMAFSNRAVVALLLSTVINSGIGTQVYSNGKMYFWRYSVKSFAMQPLAGSIAGAVSFGAAIIAPPIAKKLGGRNSWLVANALSIACYLFMMFFGGGNPTVFIIVESILAVGTSLTGVWGIQLWLNAGEIQLYETGIDIRSFTMGLQNYNAKLGFLISGPFIALMLNKSGYVASATGGGVLADPARFMLWWTLIPIIALGVSFLNLFFNYKVDDAYAKECATKNLETAKARAAAQAASAN